MNIVWDEQPGGRAFIPWMNGQRMPYAVCTFAPASGPQVYEAWSRPADKYRQPEPLACNLTSADEAKAIVERQIESEWVAKHERAA